MFAQHGGADDIHFSRYAQDAIYQQRSDEIEAFIYQQTVRDAGASNLPSRSVLTIPVVIHIMHLPGDSTPQAGTSNIPDDQVASAITYLNDAFRNTGAFAGGPFYSNAGIPSTDVEIEFCLAQFDPQGNPTTGILRVPTDLSNLDRDALCPSSSITQDECLKALSFWDSNNYMNVWLVNNICTNGMNGSCDVKGYSYLAAAHGETYDGPVIKSAYFGTSPDYTVPAIREVGHYLNLFDTHVDPPGPKAPCVNDNCLLDGDRVCDTPPDSDPDSPSCLLGQTVNTCSTDADDTSPNNPFSSDVEDMYENFMDGGEMDCKNTFTPGQKTRMRVTLLGIRSSLLSSSGCMLSITNVSLTKVSAPERISCETPTPTEIEFVNNGTSVVGSLELGIRLDNGQVFKQSWYGNLQPGDTAYAVISPSTIVPGRHLLEVEILDVNGQGIDSNRGDNTITHIFVQTDNNVSLNQFPYCVDFEGGQMPSGWVMGDFDGVISPDLIDLTMCKNLGDFSLRYNTSGFWNNGTGVGAATSGTHEAFISPIIDLSGFQSASISFDYAHKQSWPSKPLELDIYVMRDDCEGTPIQIMHKTSQELETSSSGYDPTIIGWTPSGCDEWSTLTVALDQFTGQKFRLIFDIVLEAEFSQNLYLDNICIEAGRPCVFPTEIPHATGVYVADDVCRDSLGWSHFFKRAATPPETTEDLILFSIKDLSENGAVVLPQEVKVVLTDNFGNGAHDLTSIAPYAKNTFGWYVMGRYFEIRPSKQPDQPLPVRFYYNTTDWDDLSAAISPRAMAGHEQLIFYGLPLNANANPGEGHASVAESDYKEYKFGNNPGLGSWISQPVNQFFSATFLVDSLGAGGGGTGGEGLGIGALYPTPIINFTFEQRYGDLELTWSTSKEENTDYFEIYRSLGNSDFVKLDELPASGFTDDPINYSYIDQSPATEDRKYFVKLIHTHEMWISSDTIAGTFDPSRVVKIYPNPVMDFVKVDMDAGPNEPVQFSLYDAGWKELTRSAWIHGERPPEVNLSQIPPGVYFYVVFFRGERYRGKLIKLPEQ